MNGHPVTERWSCVVQLFPAVAEIPSPPVPLAERHTWLRTAMRGTWAQLQASAPAGSPDYLEWRGNLVRALTGLSEDCIIYTHFIALNVAVGAALGSDAVVSFRPDHASISVFEADAAGLRLVQLGREADTSVLPGR